MPFRNPDFSIFGDSVRLWPICQTGASGIRVRSAEQQSNAVAVIFLPVEQTAALREACAAFNDVMDRHEAVTTEREIEEVLS